MRSNADWLRGFFVYPEPVAFYANWPVRLLPGMARHVYFIVEPTYALRFPDVRRMVEQCDLVLTWNQHILDFGFPHVTKFIGTCPWQPVAPTPKKAGAFGVSMACSNKAISTGHVMRRRVFDRLGEITIPVSAFNSTLFPIAESQAIKLVDRPAMFQTMFHIAVESAFEPHYFSEKILDCFMSKTVPIYIGCPNLGDYFDTSGVIQVDSENAVIAACNALTPESYYSRMKAMEHNYWNAVQYQNLSGRIWWAIQNKFFSQ